MYYTIYQITNLMNGRVYIGCHKTEDLGDGYLGSGKLIKRAIKKHGPDCFSKTYLYIFDNAEEMFDKEIEIVNEDFIKREDTYNIKEGGRGGAMDMKETDYYKSGEHSKNYKRAVRKSNLTSTAKKHKRINEYKLNPSYCCQCQRTLDYEKRHNKFCGKSCAATFNNTGRVVTPMHRLKVSASLKQYHLQKSK